MEMSPDGQWLASVFDHEPEKNVRLLGLGVMRIDTGEVRLLQRSKDVSLLRMNWVGDQRILATLMNKYGAYSRYAFGMDGSEVTEIASPSVFGILGDMDMIHPRGPGPDEVVMARQAGSNLLPKASWRTDGVVTTPGVFRLNVKTAESKLIVADPGRTTEWFADPQGRVRVAVGVERSAFRDDGRVKDKRRLPGTKIFWIRDDGTGEEISGIETELAERFGALGFAADGNSFLFIGRQGRDCAALFAYRHDTRKVEGPIYAREGIDIMGGITSDHDSSVAGVWYQDGTMKIEWLDPRLKAVQAAVDAALPGRVNVFANWSRDGTRFLVLSSASDEPGIYYLLDTKRGQLSEVYRRAAWLKGMSLGRAEPVRIKARDGETLHGFLTRPPAAAGKGPLATVLLVHGGPWDTRDDASFNPEVQFYATRGYAVLQVNFRGSSGYGRRFEEIAKKQFGGTMQADLDDAIDWAVSEGIADPRKLVVAGASYGGYATLMALTANPTKFRAGVAMFPVADLVRQIGHYEKDADLYLESGFASEWWKEWVGHPERDRAALLAASPMQRLHRMQSPLFVVYGENDPRIDFSQSADLVRGLRALKKKFVRFAPPAEGHGLYKEENRYKVFAELEKFLLAEVPPN